jgi:hypothetical protein
VTVNDSTIMIIIVGPMIGRGSALLLLLLLIVAMIAIMIVGSFNDMCQSVQGGPLRATRSG